MVSYLYKALLSGFLQFNGNFADAQKNSKYRDCMSPFKWNPHVESVIAKAAKRLYALRVLRRAVVTPKDILKVYLCNVMSVLEYAAQV